MSVYQKRPFLSSPAYPAFPAQHGRFSSQSENARFSVAHYGIMKMKYGIKPFLFVVERLQSKNFT